MDISSIPEVLFSSIDYWLPAYSAWVLLTVTYFYAQKIEDNSIIDIAWGLGHILQVGVQVLIKLVIPTQSLHWRDFLLLGLVTLWGLRLTWHIGKRHSGEDWRYRDVLRKRFAHKNLIIFRIKIYIWIFMLQFF